MRFSIGKFFSRKYSSRPENVSQPEKACPQPEKACSQPEKACSQPERICPRRLIDTRTLNLVDLNEGDPVPPYAILSHRWIQGQEISYQEFLDGDEETRSKSGYLKIAAACVTACEDKINFIWVDTCCIDKGSHEDVVRNIRSMYAYYQNARVCYAHLADMKLLVTDGMKIDEMWRKRFLHSEWFKRGWTLQELLAPKKVVFFDQSWVPVGTKQSLKEMISYVTNIPSAVLSGEKSVYNIDPLERMSWTIGRRTTKPPDRAYCLLGLLDVSIKPDYDETFRESMERLRKAFVDAHPRHKRAFGSEEVPFLEVLDQAHHKIRSTKDDLLGLSEVTPGVKRKKKHV